MTNDELREWARRQNMPVFADPPSFTTGLWCGAVLVGALAIWVAVWL